MLLGGLGGRFGFDLGSEIQMSIQISENHYLVGITSHAYGESLFRYIEKVEPSVVITDSYRGKNNATTLAKSIEKEMGIRAYPSIEAELD